jgi:signal transduction histidine kinase
MCPNVPVARRQTPRHYDGGVARRARLVVRVYAFVIACVVAVAAVWTGIFVIAGPSMGPKMMPPPVQLAAVARARDAGERTSALTATGHPITVYDATGTLIGSTHAAPVPSLDATSLASLRAKGTMLVGQDRIAVALTEDGKMMAYGVFDIGPPPLPRGIVVGAIAAISFALLVGSLIFARSLARPLRSLEAAADAFGNGRHDVRIRPRTTDEIGAVGRAFDLMAERVATSVRSHRELMANVAHELRTPMARVRMALDIARSGNGELASKMLGEIEADIEDLEQLVQDVLTSARLDLADSPVARHEIRVRELLADVAARSNELDPAHDVRIDLDDSDATIRADSALLRRVLDNLVTNARTYSDPGSPVILRARHAARGVCLEIEDRGIGIGAEHLERVFEPFFRVNASRGREPGGAGLGLALSKKIVEAHGGSISIASRVGQGTTVRIELTGAPHDG